MNQLLKYQKEPKTGQKYLVLFFVLGRVQIFSIVG